MSNDQHNRPRRLKLAAPPTEEDKARARQALGACAHCERTPDELAEHDHADDCPNRVRRLDEVAGTALLDDVAAFLERFVVFQSDAQRDAVALWAAHTHCFDTFATTPRLSVRSPEKESGKTRLAVEVLGLLVRDPLPVANISEAALFRLVASQKVTLLHDEADAVFGAKARDREDFRALLNAGHRRGAEVVRCVGEGSKMDTKRFPVFAPVALAGIGSLPDTLESRSIVIALKRRAPNELIEDFELDAVEGEGHALRDALASWAEAVDVELGGIRPQRVDGIRDRAWDNWRPLLAIAEKAGDGWPERARKAAVALTASAAEDDQSRGVQLLRDIFGVFGEEEAMFTTVLVGKLNALEESPWGGWRNGQGLDGRGLARLLRPYGVRRRDIRIGDEHGKGYRAEDFADAWGRYLPPDARSIGDTVTSLTPQGNASVTPTPLVTDRKTPESLTPQRLSPLSPIEGAGGEPCERCCATPASLTVHGHLCAECAERVIHGRQP